MREQRWPWLLAAALMSGAALAAAFATYLYWLPCRGSMLVGTIAEGLSSRRDFTDECLRRMNAGLPFSHDVTERIPWVHLMTVIALVLCSVAWLVLVLALRWSAKTKAVAALVSLPGLAMSTVALTSPEGAALYSEATFSWPSWPLALIVLIAVTAIYNWQPEVRGYSFARVLVLLWGATTFGFFHQAGDYLIMSSWSSANWDVPPGTGIVTVGGLIVSAVVTVVLTVRAPQPENRSQNPIVTTTASAE